MKTIRMLGIAAAVVVAVTATTGTARAEGIGHGPFGNTPAYPRYYTLSSYVCGKYFGGHKAPLPTFQAAPWYLYWPYDAHFLTPAPVSGAFYGPPTPGNFPVNPYFPGPAFGSYGPIPGGPPPMPGGPMPPAPVGAPR
jgi:hypothetical protein